ncbi:uncharacterized protein CTRU02_203536 [Colletotrichum truncatum]|uniref:Uncharacterized protein n=1 Tax=Colletotrichum truncatum TaxID=5467 RepID=A0ACC3Z9K3_COLTU
MSLSFDLGSTKNNFRSNGWVQDWQTVPQETQTSRAPERAI